MSGGTTSAAIAAIVSRLETVGFKKTKLKEEELPDSHIQDKVFLVKNPSGGGTDAEFGNSLYDATDSINVVIFLPIGEDYIAGVKDLGTDRETIIKDLLNKNNWATATTGIVIVKYEGHSVEEFVDCFRDELKFSVRIRRSL